METLTDLIQVVNRKRISKIDVLDKTFLNAKSENLYYKLYHAIETKQVKTDEEAALLIYGSGRNDTRYKVLKSRLKEKVLNTALFLDAENLFNNKIGRIYQDCLKQASIVEVIMKLTGTSKLAFELAKENYSIAEKYKFYDILKRYSYVLMSYHAFTGNERMFYKYEKKYLSNCQLAEKEIEAKHLYFLALIHFEINKPITQSVLDKVELYLQRILAIKIELNNPEIDFYYYFIALTYNEYINDVETLIRICLEANEKMKTNPDVINNTRQVGILNYNVRALLFAKKYKEGLKLFEPIYNQTIIVPDAFYNWFLLKESEFKLYLHGLNIPEAYHVYEKVLANKYYNRQVDLLKERWKIYHAYLVFLDNYLNKGDYKFSLPKFFNSVPLNTRDKSGFNFAIRIIEILFLAARKQYNKVFAQVETLRIYRSRYLNDITYKRNHLFLSLLLKSEKSGFDAKSMQNANWPEIQELRERKHFIAEWEIIPYEELWGIFVNLAMK